MLSPHAGTLQQDGLGSTRIFARRSTVRSAGTLTVGGRRPGTQLPAPPSTERLSDPLKAEWIARYHSEKGLG